MCSHMLDNRLIAFERKQDITAIVSAFFVYFAVGSPGLGAYNSKTSANQVRVVSLDQQKQMCNEFIINPIGHSL